MEKNFLKKSPPTFINTRVMCQYKGYVKIGVFGMIDDEAGVRESGIKAKQVNSLMKKGS